MGQTSQGIVDEWVSRCLRNFSREFKIKSHFSQYILPLLELEKFFIIEFKIITYKDHVKIKRKLEIMDSHMNIQFNLVLSNKTTMST